jgi:hypothetical protein
VLGAAATALATEWLRFQEGWTLAAVPAALGGIATVVAVARSYRARRAWRRAREQAAAGEPVPPAPQVEPQVEEAPARVQARSARERASPSVPRRDAPASLLDPNDLDGADAAPDEIASDRPGPRERARGRVETD